MPEKRLDIGTHRVCAAEETLAKWLPKLGDFGITRIADVTGLDRIGIPVTLAIRPNSRSVAVSQGKGMTLADAKASAMMEAIEIWHAEHFDKPVLYGTEANLGKQHKILETGRLPLVKNVEYQETEPLLWVEGIEFFSQEKALVPYEMVHADYTRPAPPFRSIFHASTNGLASGNHRLEAICHALTELIERDALTLWHDLQSSARAATRIDVNTLENPQCIELLHRYSEAGLECGLWDVTSDIAVPCVMAVIRERDGTIGHMGLGSGCHLDSGVATRRALTEAAQTRLNYVSGARDDLDLSEYDAEGLADKNAFANELFSYSENRRQFDDLPSNIFTSLEEDLNYLLACFKDVGISEVIAVELTQPQHGVEVYRMVVPGLEAPHDDSTYQPGERLRKRQHEQ